MPERKAVLYAEYVAQDLFPTSGLATMMIQEGLLPVKLAQARFITLGTKPFIFKFVLKLHFGKGTPLFTTV